MTLPVPEQPTTVSWFPSLKVYGGGAAGIVAAIIVWALSQYAHVDLPLLIQQGLPVVLGFVAAYFLPHTTGAPGSSTTPPVIKP